MMNKKLIALFVAIATVASISADRYTEQQYHTVGDVDYNTYNNNYDRRDYRNRDNRSYRPLRDTAGNIVKGTGNAVKDVAEVPSNVVHDIFSPRN